MSIKDLKELIDFEVKNLLESFGNQTQNTSISDIKDNSLPENNLEIQYSKTFEQIYKTLFGRNSDKSRLKGNISLGDDDNFCTQHVYIELNQTNKRIFGKLCKISCSKFNQLYIGKQRKSIIIALDDEYACGGYFHLYPDIEDSYFDGETEFISDEEFFEFIAKVSLLIYELIH